MNAVLTAVDHLLFSNTSDLIWLSSGRESSPLIMLTAPPAVTLKMVSWKARILSLES